MQYKNKIYFSLLWIVLGIAMILCHSFKLLQNDMWSGIGFGWLLCGIFQMLKQLRYRTDSRFREAYDVAVGDERNRFIAARAWAWAGWCFVITAGAVALVCGLMGQNEIATAAAFGICLIVFFYWAAYMILKRKY